MKRFAKLFILSCTMLLLWSPNCFAIGFGAFIDASGGSGDMEWETDYYSWDVDSRAGAVGFVLDTSPTKERIFNYRLNVGFARQELKDDYDVTMKSNGVYAENIFGFAFIREENFRWWAGPLVRIGYYSGDSGTVQQWPDTTIKTDVDYAEFGLGAVTGLNFKAGNTILSPSVGVRFIGFAGEGKTITRNNFGSFSQTEDFEGNTSNIFANFAVLF